MKKRILAFLLAVSIAVSVLVLPVSAASINNTALQTAITLGAVPTGQELSANITRGAFAKMLVSFSTYRESVGAQGTVGTLYRDVPGSSQWAPYIRIAVQQGWMNGYTDGSFRPDNTVTLEEACAAVLKLLSYKTTDLTGSFPQAQLNKAQQIGLRDQLTCTQGQAMTYEQSTLLLYNALRANTASGSARLHSTTAAQRRKGRSVSALCVIVSLPFARQHLRHGDGHSRADMLGAGDFQLCPVCPGNAGAECQPDAAAACGPAAGLVHHVKCLGHAGQIGGGDAAARIRHGENHLPGAALTPQGDGCTLDALTGSLGIEGQVAQHIHPQAAVYLHHAPRADDTRHGRTALRQAAHGLQQKPGILTGHQLQRPGLIQPHQRQQTAAQVFQSLGLVVDVARCLPLGLGVIGPGAHQVSIAEHRGHRGLDLVRKCRNKVLLALRCF